MPIIKMKPFQIFGEISRVDEEQRIVEGYAFVNEVVPGEGGVRLTRAAMEAATEDYLANGTSREMHQPNAVAKPLTVTWDEKGALLRVKVVDDQAWNKVKEGVYKGYSVGVKPTIMRGKNITACQWWDSSLIDVGKDRDAKFTLWRSAELDPDAEVEVDFEEDPEENEIERCEEIERAKWTKEKRDNYDRKNFGWPEERKYPIEDQADVESAAKLIGKAPEGMRAKIKKRIVAICKRLKLTPPEAWTEDTQRYIEATGLLRGLFADLTAEQMTYSLRYLAFDLLSSTLWIIQGTEYIDATEKEADVRLAIEEFSDFIVPVIAAGTWPDPDIFDGVDEDIDRSAAPTLQRMFDSRLESTALLERATTAEATAIERLQTISALESERDETKTELERVQGLERAATERVAELEKMPTRVPPARNFQALERTFGSPLPDEDKKKIETLKTRKDEIMRSMVGVTDANLQRNAAQEVLLIGQELTRLGA